jgi:hypothetical protein
MLTCLLPRELYILISEADMADKQVLVAKADWFAAHRSKQAHDEVVANIFLQKQEREDTLVAAVRPGASSGQRGSGSEQLGSTSQCWSKKKSRQGSSGEQVTHTISHAEQARIQSGICFAHFCYSAKARRCVAPCNWSRN